MMSDPKALFADDVLKDAVLLIKELKGRKTAELHLDRAYAEQLAREFVGDHNPIDGCSSKPRAESYSNPHGTRFYISRNSSFGTRKAHVVPIGQGFEMELP